MNNQFKINYSRDAYPTNMNFFTVAPTNVATQKRDIVEYSSRNPLNDNRLFFIINGVRNQAIDLNGIRLMITCKLVNADDIRISIVTGSWDTTEKTDTTEEAARKKVQETLIKTDVFPINNLGHSMCLFIYVF